MKYYEKNNNLMVEEIDNEVIVFDIENEKFYEFDEIGSFIWHQIDGKPFENIIESICEKFEIDRKTALEDTISFINELSEKSLIFQK